ncbi:GNAT family N-acetyltransferase [Paenibacillus agri]|uniref:GNAT family N-acetyltransferase n=1 Tax=Paenibacillus agri TaxID=2744309 RepID=A0A850ESH7_9BACL|nr:GNAT family N-acetyltransferase [Paenibacillus agri]NUU63496.1 GNAT family N-acetyltransferase [Paenibacillus agri]
MQLRLIRNNELDQAAALADAIFRNDGDLSMKQLFPAIFQPGISHSYGAFTSDGTLAAFMGLVPSVIQAEDILLEVFSIGAVCTAPAYRGVGLAGQLLKLCQAHAARAGASLIFVSGDRSLYERAGCVPFGAAVHAELTQDSAQALAAAAGDAWTLRPMQPGDLPAVNRLLLSRQAGHVHSPAELGLLLGAAAYAGVLGLPQRTLVAERDGSIEGFVAVAVAPAAGDGAGAVQPAAGGGAGAALPAAGDGAGAALPAPESDAPNQGTALEWAGRPEAVAALLAKAALCTGTSKLQVPVPWQERSLLSLLRDARAAMTGGANSGTVCIADRGALLRQTEAFRASRNIGLSAATDDRGLISLLFDPASPLLPAGTPEGDATLPLPYMAGLNFI